MRLTTCLLAVVWLPAALPSGALAQTPPPRVSVPAPMPPPPTVPPPRFYPSVPAPGPRPPPPPAYYGPRYWYSFGWGYYPVYVPMAYAPPSGYAPGPAPREENRIYSRVSLYGAGQDQGYMAGLFMLAEGRRFGFDMDISALAQDQVTGPHSGDDPATWASTHLTWTLVADRSYRIRLLTGGSMLVLPDSPATLDKAWRGKRIFGIDAGLSGQIGLVGPVGIEGYARYTPYPVRIADTFIGATVHGGMLGLSAGWRWVNVDGDEIDAPQMFFRGPQLGLVIAF